MIIAKKLDDTNYELFTIVTEKDFEGNDVQMPRSIGQYTLESLQSDIVDAQEKIDAINKLQENV